MSCEVSPAGWTSMESCFHCLGICLLAAPRLQVRVAFVAPWSFVVLFLSRIPFSRMRSKGSRFTLGVWGLRVCSLDVASASATVRNRPRDPHMAVPIGSFPEVVLFLRFQTCGCFVSRGRRGTSWHSDVFWNVSKVVLRGRRNTFVTFSEDVLQFSWAGAALWTCPSSFFVAGAEHFRRVVLRVFCKLHWQGCVKWRQGANSVAVVAFCAMCWKFTEASHETSILRLQIFRF